MRAGVSFALVVSMFLLACPLGMLEVDHPSLVSASPGTRSGETMVIDSNCSVDHYEVWSNVVVESTGSLIIGDGGHLVADSVTLLDNAQMHLQGGVLEIEPRTYREFVGISGHCSWFEITKGSLVNIRGPDGGYDVPTSRGCSVGLNLTSTRTMMWMDSTISLTAGNGFSPPESLTDGDLDGYSFAGGDVTMSVTLVKDNDMLILSNCKIALTAGNGGRAPDGQSPIRGGDGDRGGIGGGYTRGGDVSGNVGSGGDVDGVLSSDHIMITDTTLNMTAGNGGDAGDGGSTKWTTDAGCGGGGYSGGDGASASNAQDPPGPGGSVSEGVGKGGDVSFNLVGGWVELEGARIEMLGGDGGDAGDGGSLTDGGGGAGGGGYSGGGGGNHGLMPGGDGGTVTGSVGRGGDVSATLTGADTMDIGTSRVLATAGNGGEGGDGGDAGALAGGGGGGYTGGGGGADGNSSGGTPGTDGGAGGALRGSVGSGGDASLLLESPRLVSTTSVFNVVGGSGGDEGGYGNARIDENQRPACGGGAGGHSSGGGGGAGHEGQTYGSGGSASDVLGKVGDGGNASLDIQSERLSLHRNTMIYVLWGDCGSTRSLNLEDPQGKARVRSTRDGTRWEYIPKSEVILWSPGDRLELHFVPSFEWMPVHRSTEDGDVVHYLFKMARDIPFTEIVTETTSVRPDLSIPDLQMGTYYWKVIAVYRGPPQVNGPEVRFSSFRFYNEPPEIDDYPTVTVIEDQPKSIYLGYYFHDRDTFIDDLVVEIDHPGVESITGLFVIFYYEWWEAPHRVHYSVSDGVSTTMGHVIVEVIDANEAPVIVSVGERLAPYQWTMAELEEEWLKVEADDPDDDPLTYTLTSDMIGVEITPAGVIVLHPDSYDLGSNRLKVIVDDGRGGTASVVVWIVVVRSNRPPEPPEVFSPADRSVFREGDLVVFSVRVSDPDIPSGAWLNVTFWSDTSGTLGQTSTQSFASLATDRLSPGDHRIVITVDDGTYEKSVTLHLTVDEAEESSPPPGQDHTWLYVLFAFIFIIVVTIGYLAGSSGVEDPYLEEVRR